ncbi:MAG: permease-like cell division protein FtsX, partial [bacterium]|nr:permease-like cell division protein FtsX [bacterium]
MLISLKRVINSGWKGFSRNMGLSLATVFIMIMVILMITFLLLLNPVSENLIADVKQKVDISVYFKEDAIEENIMQVKMEISRMPEINEVEYISKEEALENFLNRHKEDTVLVESLTEVGYNPFLASLNIRAQEAFQYEQISGFLENSPFKELVNKIDYNERKSVIEKVYAFTAGVKNGGIVFSIFLAVIALVIAYNTIRIAIQNSKEELAVMRLVGASNWFVRGPFLAQGVMVGFISAIIAFIITFAFSYGIN